MTPFTSVHDATREPCACILCNEIARRDSISSLSGKSILSLQAFLFQVDSVVLIPDIRPIVAGHSLIVTREHVCSFAQAAENTLRDLVRVKLEAVNSLGRFCKGFFFFEHGASPSSRTTGGCIAHAHIHFIPVMVDVYPYLAHVSVHPLSIAPIEMRSSLPRDGADYLYYEDMNGNGCIVVNPHKPLPRQFVRMVVAEQTGLDDWDWRTVLDDEDGAQGFASIPVNRSPLR